MGTLISKPTGVIFDWDNTLVDSWPTIHQAMNATLEAMGHSLWTFEETKSRVALSMRDTFPQTFGDRWPEARDVFYATFRSINLHNLTPMPGARSLLDALGAAEVPLMIVSNKSGPDLRREVEHIGWAPLFRSIIGAGDAKADKPAPDHGLLALERAGMTPARSIWFVGDAGVDMRIGDALGLTKILVRDEPLAPEALSGVVPDLVVPDAPALEAFFRTL